MRGALHLLTPEEGGVFLSLMAAGRSWERPSWQRYFGMAPKKMEVLRGAVREALNDRDLTRDELIAEVIKRPGFRDLDNALRSGWGTLLKPIAWQGDLCYGPNRGGRVTFTLPHVASARWAGVPPTSEAAPVAVGAYLSAYGPATMDAFNTWLTGGWFGKRRLRGWFEALGDRLVEVEVDGEPAYALAEDLEAMAATKPSTAVRMLAGFDQYVLGPGTADEHIVPAGRRAAVSRQGGWISPVVVSGGVVRGTWSLDRDQTKVLWFKESGRVPRKALRAEVERLASILGRELRTELASV
jgi:hypothetical protein